MLNNTGHGVYGEGDPDTYACLMNQLNRRETLWLLKEKQPRKGDRNGVLERSMIRMKEGGEGVFLPIL